MKSINLNVCTKVFLLLILCIVTIFPRFYRLGYSHFYGDETKAFNYKKNFSTLDFVKNQRKGPIQFLITTATERLFKTADETTLRMPFAIASAVSVLILFLLVHKLFGFYTAYVASMLFSVNGFILAFSRTVQYQSFVILFGITALYFAVLSYTKTKEACMFISGFFIALALLTHYDAIFFVLPTIYLILKDKWNKKYFLKVIVLFVMPITVLVSLYYVPYLRSEFFATNVTPYLQQRLSGTALLPNSSIFTFFVYNPFKWIVLLLICILGIFSTKTTLKQTVPIILWILVPLITFELIFSNPGTHIYNYIIPACVLIGIGFIQILKLTSRVKLIQILLILNVSILILSYTVTNIFIFTPSNLNNYPWTDTQIANITLKKVAIGKYQLFLYGFPYNRGWNQVRTYMFSTTHQLHGGNNFSTNDNVTIAEFYMYPIMAYHKAPTFYYEVFDNQLNKAVFPEIADKTKYKMLKEVYVDNKLTGRLYLRAY